MELVYFVRDAAEILGTQHELDGVFNILDEGTSAERQLEVYKESGGDVRAVVDWLIEETMKGIVEPSREEEGEADKPGSIEC